MTRVVNIYKEEYDEYIGRAGKGKSGYYGNNHPIGFCQICQTVHDRESCIAAFKKDFDHRIANDPEYKRRVLELKDKVLGCFCPDAPMSCHGHVIVDWLDCCE